MCQSDAPTSTSISTREYLHTSLAILGRCAIVTHSIIVRNTLRSDSDSYTTRTNVKPDPIFSVVGANVLTMKNHSDRRPSALSFRTILAMTNAGTHRTLQSYPYDKSVGQTVDCLLAQADSGCQV